MPLGDSITYGINHRGGYRILLEKLLEEIGVQPDFVGTRRNGPVDLKSKRNEGHPGWTIGEVRTIVDDRVPKFNPEIILLIAGTNDIMKPNPDFKALGAAHQELCDHLLQLQPKATLFVGTIPPCAAQWNANVHAYNQELRTRYGGDPLPLRFVDVHSYLDDGDIDPDDGDGGIHPSAEGYDKIARAWFEALRVFFKKS